MEILAMGGYGGYVWSSFGLTLIVVIVSALQARARQRGALREITSQIQSMEPRQ